ncbi:MAG: hypothetical protein IT245_05335 [Bacteroidia bacterium]|nr:hypothetical protein [Bacteroidia bacterium]
MNFKIRILLTLYIFSFSLIELRAQSINSAQVSIHLDANKIIQNIDQTLRTISLKIIEDSEQGILMIYDTTGKKRIKKSLYQLFYFDQVIEEDMISTSSNLQTINLFDYLVIEPERMLIKSHPDKSKWFSINRQDFEQYLGKEMKNFILQSMDTGSRFKTQLLYSTLWTWLQNMNSNLYLYQLNIPDTSFTTKMTEEIIFNLRYDTYIKLTLKDTTDPSSAIDTVYKKPYYALDTLGRLPSIDLLFSFKQLCFEFAGIGPIKYENYSRHSLAYIRKNSIPNQFAEDIERLKYLARLQIYVELKTN